MICNDKYVLCPPLDGSTDRQSTQINSIVADVVVLTRSAHFSGAVFLIMQNPHVFICCLIKCSNPCETNLLTIIERVLSRPWCPKSV